MYVTQEKEKSSTAYNLPCVFKLHGEVDVERLKNSLQTIAARHEILRTDFIMENDLFKQKIHDKTDIDFAYTEDNDTSVSLLALNFVQAFDLSKSPLFRAKLVKKADCSILLIDIHHIVCDAISM